MCDPFTMVVGLGASALGNAVSGGTATKNAARVSAENNRVLRETLDKNKPEQEAARGLFDERLMSTGGFDGQLADAQATKRADYAGNLTGPTEAPMTGRSTPKIIQDAFARKLAESFTRAEGMADRQGDVAGYSKMWSDRAFDDRQAGRDANLFIDRIRGNLSILPDQQQFATSQVRPQFDWGQIISGAGQLAGGMRGNVVGAGGPTNIIPRGY